MKKTPILLATFLLALLVYPRTDTLPDKKEQFGIALELCQNAYAEGTPSKCKLYGKIQVVDNFPDVKVQKVEHFPDIKVKWVEHFPDAPGKWQKVDHFPDFKVQFVEHFPDYKVQVVEHFPGCD